jgi:aspartate-semialdehyde dehydrogenase
MGVLAESAGELLDDPGAAILEIDRRLTQAMRGEGMPVAHFGVPLAGSLIPWIDSPTEGGRTREEWKAQVEANKILGRTERPVPIDGICVRIGAMRCHAQALTIKLRRSVAVAEVESMLGGANDWVKVVPNEPEPSKHELTPAAVSGTLDIPIGRLRHLSLGPEYLAAFTVGDQLLWGAAEPLRRMLRILRST